MSVNETGERLLPAETTDTSKTIVGKFIKPAGGESLKLASLNVDKFQTRIRQMPHLSKQDTTR